MSGRDLDLLRRLRKYELNVIEVNNWQTRGAATLKNKGHITHHTAGPRSGNAPSLGVCINGLNRPDLGYYLPGPLCQTFTARNNDVYLIASGTANHAGKGGWKGYSGNSAFSGTEHEHTGLDNEPVSDARWETLARVAAAHADGKFDVSMCINHFEWTTRKIDFRKQINDANKFRARVQELLKLGGAKPKPEPEPKPEIILEDDMVQVRRDPRDGKVWVITTAGKWHISRKLLNTWLFTKFIDASKDTEKWTSGPDGPNPPVFPQKSIALLDEIPVIQHQA